MTTFDQLGLSSNILKAIKTLGFEKATEIQEQAIPVLLDAECDFIGLAQTGTGKTAAFGLPLLELIDGKQKQTQALILAPTRELCQQIASQLDDFGAYLNRIKCVPVFGGASISTQIRDLQSSPQIIVATPGRLLDLTKRGAVDLGNLKWLVLDEADEMVNMGFKDELDAILAYTPEEKQTWLFSATMPKEIRKLVNQYMNSPLELKVNQGSTVNEKITHQFAEINKESKYKVLTKFIDLEPEMRGIIFCRTRRDTQELSERLMQGNYSADALHGDMSQAQRDKVMSRFRTHQLPLLIATDVAARGIDVNDVSHVFHYSLPDETAFYTHRSGRTARAGKTGRSIVFVDNRNKRKLIGIANELDIDFEKVEIPSYHAIANHRIEQWCMDVLKKPIKGKIDDSLISKAQVLFGNLSKEELISKLLVKEMESVLSEESQEVHHEKRRDRDDRDRDRGPRQRYKSSNRQHHRSKGKNHQRSGRKGRRRN